MIIFDELKDMFFGNERGSALQQIALSNGWDYKRRIRFDQLEYQVNDFDLFKGRDTKRIENIITFFDNSNGAEIKLYDYKYQSRHTSVLQIQLYKTKLIRFSVQPKTFFFKLTRLFVEQMDSLDLDESFLNLYRVEGRSTIEIQQFFTPAMQSLFVQEQNLQLEAELAYLVIYKKNVSLNPKEIPFFMEMGQDIVRMIRENPGTDYV